MKRLRSWARGQLPEGIIVCGARAWLLYAIADPTRAALALRHRFAVRAALPRDTFMHWPSDALVMVVETKPDRVLCAKVARGLLHAGVDPARAVCRPAWVHPDWMLTLTPAPDREAEAARALLDRAAWLAPHPYTGEPWYNGDEVRVA